MSDKPTVGHVNPVPGVPTDEDIRRMEAKALKVSAVTVETYRAKLLAAEAERDRYRAALEAAVKECEEQAQSWTDTADIDEERGLETGRARGSAKAYQRIARMLQAALNPPTTETEPSNASK